MKLRTLTLRGIPEPLLKAFRASAARNRRSLNAEVLVRLEAGAAAERAAHTAGEASAGPAAATLYTVWGISAHNVLAVGPGGTLLRYGGGRTE
jgi:plasmid stability protein